MNYALVNISPSCCYCNSHELKTPKSSNPVALKKVFFSYRFPGNQQIPSGKTLPLGFLEPFGPETNPEKHPKTNPKLRIGCHGMDPEKNISQQNTVQQQKKKAKKDILGGGFKYFLFSPLLGEDFPFDSYFSDGLKPPTSIHRKFCSK